MYRPRVAHRPEGPVPLPPLTAMRAFEAAARHGSFTRAAEELSVTQTAVSHQVRLLEDTLGAPLFVRAARRITLTATGREWASALSDVFARLYDANRRLQKERAAGRALVALTVLPSFASRWLVPRLGRFLETCPGVDLRLSTTADLVPFTDGEFDLGIRYGLGRYPGLVVEKLYDDAWVIVCTPAVKARHRLRHLADLGRVELLRDDDRQHWERFLIEAGARGIDPNRGTVISDSSLVVEAAARGQGVAVARRSLAADDLATGRLVRAFPSVPEILTGLSYFLVGPRISFTRKEIVAFRDWLVRETASFRAPQGVR